MEVCLKRGGSCGPVVLWFCLHLRRGALASAGHQEGQQDGEAEDLEDRLGGLDTRNQGDENLIPQVLADKEDERKDDQEGNEGDEGCASRRDAHARFALKGFRLAKGRVHAICDKSTNHVSIQPRDFILTVELIALRMMRHAIILSSGHLNAQIALDDRRAMLFQVGQEGLGFDFVPPKKVLAVLEKVVVG
jgi:hypothetical protein